MMNCHLANSGKPTLPVCGELSECTKTLQGELWNTYTLMFANAQQTCNYIKLELRQALSQTLMDDLESTSSQVRADL